MRLPLGSMDEQRVPSVAIGRICTALSASLFIAAAVVAYRSNRSYRAWLATDSPYNAPRARLRTMGATYTVRRGTATDAAEIVNTFLDGFARGRAGRDSGP